MRSISNTDEEPAKGISNVVRRFFTNLNTGRWATKQHYAHACSSKKRNKRGVRKSQLRGGDSSHKAREPLHSNSVPRHFPAVSLLKTTFGKKRPAKS